MDTPAFAFQIGNMLALSGWVALVAPPPKRRWTPTVWKFTGRTIPLLLAVAYVALIAAYWVPGGVGSLAQVRQLFDQPGLLAAGWLHYLAFDLFVGTWIARRAGELDLPHALAVPCLLLTFMFGPAGLLAFAALQLAHPTTRAAQR